MPLDVALWCVAIFLGAICLSIAMSRMRAASSTIYGLSFLASLVALVAALFRLFDSAAMPPAVSLPLGLPWLGANFRMDALAAFFLAVVNLGAAAASLFATGYGEHEDLPERVLPFYPAFLAGMNLVVLADDEYTFLVSWEFMSLASTLACPLSGGGDDAHAIDLDLRCINRCVIWRVSGKHFLQPRKRFG